MKKEKMRALSCCQLAAVAAAANKVVAVVKKGLLTYKEAQQCHW